MAMSENSCDYFLEALASKAPVSYTHLDVYKRQHDSRMTLCSWPSRSFSFSSRWASLSLYQGFPSSLHAALQDGDVLFIFLRTGLRSLQNYGKISGPIVL